jgi:DNA modification methylase
MSGKNFLDGKVTLLRGDSSELIKGLPENSIDAVVCDPPYALVSIVKRFGGANAAPAKGNEAYARASAGFMGKTWDTGEVAFSEAFWADVLRVLKPGGHLVAFSGTRTYHRMAVAIEDAGFEIRDQIGWAYGCLDEHTQAVTPWGLKAYNALKTGDFVLSYDVDNRTYQWDEIEDVFTYRVSDTAYRISTEHGDQLVSRNHRCLVERDGAETFVLAEEAARQCAARVPVLEDLPALLAALPDPHERASRPQQDVRASVRGGARQQGKDGHRVAARDAQGQVTGDVRSVWQGVLAQYQVAAKDRPPRLLQTLQRAFSWAGLEGARAQGTRGVEAGIRGRLSRALDGVGQSLMEGWRHLSQAQGQLRLSALCSLPAGVSGDVADGWLRDGASLGRSAHPRPLPHPSGECAPYRPSAAQQRTEQPDAVRDQPRAQVVRARGGHKAVVGRITPEHYDGVIWCVRVRTGAFVAVRDGFAFPTGNSGFPKSHDVSKGIAKRAGGAVVAREAVDFMRSRREELGLTRIQFEKRIFGRSDGNIRNWEDGISIPQPGLWPKIVAAMELKDTPFDDAMERGDVEVARTEGDFGFQQDGERWGQERIVRAPATDAAKQWQGWGTALKPAWEPICLARKPFAKGMTVAANVLEHGVGALNIDGCRVESTPRTTHADGNRIGNRGDERRVYCEDKSGHECAGAEGRWPANLIHDGSEEVVGAFPSEVVPPSFRKARTTDPDGNTWNLGRQDQQPFGYTDSGSAARFFYTAKADAEDRLGSKHPTVKPLDLMQWLVRLVTPKGGMVLDPFAGTGTTGEAAWREGMRAILMEREPEYQEDIARRMDLAVQPTKRAAVAASKNNLEKAEDLPLFALLAE